MELGGICTTARARIDFPKFVCKGHGVIFFPAERAYLTPTWTDYVSRMHVATPRLASLQLKRLRFNRFAANGTPSRGANLKRRYIRMAAGSQLLHEKPFHLWQKGIESAARGYRRHSAVLGRCTDYT